MRTPEPKERARIRELLKLTPTPDVDGRPAALATLVDLLQRCFVPQPDDLEGSCWLWRRAASNKASGWASPSTWWPPEQRIIPAARAAWLLAELPLGPGRQVTRIVCNDARCVNPLHCATGSKAELLAARGARGWVPPKEFTERIRREAEKRQTPLEVVRAIEADIAAGMTTRDIATRHGVSVSTVKNINGGKHPHASRRARPASVFDWAPPGRVLEEDHAPAANDASAMPGAWPFEVRA